MAAFPLRLCGSLFPTLPARIQTYNTKMKYKLTFALAASLTSTAFAEFKAPLPEFKNEKQLAEWRAEKAAETDAKFVTQETAFYTGKPYLASSGDYAFKYRNYDPELARWTSEDSSGFPDGANGQIYAPNPTSEIDFEGLRVQWITQESTYSPNSRYEQLEAVTFSWTISLWGVTQFQDSYTGTFAEVYAHAWTVGFVTWRGLNASDFGSSQSLALYSHSLVDGEHRWNPNGFTVSAGFLENAAAKNGELDGVNVRLNPIEAETSRDSLRGLSPYLYQTLVNSGAGYNGELFYE